MFSMIPRSRLGTQRGGRPFSSSQCLKHQPIAMPKALEDYSQKKNSMGSCWIKGEDESRVIPTYQLMNEDGHITNTEEFPSEVIFYSFVTNPLALKRTDT